MKTIDIKALRKGNDLTGKALAGILHCSAGFISRIENGKDKVPDDWLDILKGYPFDVENYLIDIPDPKSIIQQTNSPGSSAAIGNGAQAGTVSSDLVKAIEKQLEESRRMMELLAEQLRTSNRLNEWLQQQLDKRQ